MCYLRDKECKKRLDTYVSNLGEQIKVKVEWTQKGRIAQRGCPDVRRRIRLSQPRVRYNFERGGRSVFAPLKLRSSKREKLTENIAETRSEYRSGEAKTSLARRHPCCDERGSRHPQYARMTERQNDGSAQNRLGTTFAARRQ